MMKSLFRCAFVAIAGMMLGASFAQAQTVPTTSAPPAVRGLAPKSDVPAPPIEGSGGFAPPAPLPALSPGLATFITLGNAGLLQSFFSLEDYGLSVGRIGSTRATVGVANATGIRTGYRDFDYGLAGPFSVIKELDLGIGGASFLRVSGGFAGALANHTLQWNSGPIQAASIQYLYAPNPNRMIGTSIVYQNGDISNYSSAGAAPAISSRQAFGFRVDYAEKLSPLIGFTTRGQWTNGDLRLRIPDLGYSHIQADNEYYLQGEIIGTIGEAQASWMPSDWLLHPTVGINYVKNQIATTPDSFSVFFNSVVGGPEKYGTIWGRLRADMIAKPTPELQFVPFFAVGLEHEYRTNLNVVLSERNYAYGAVGGSALFKGQRIDIGYSIHAGFEGRRTNNVFFLATSFSL